MVRYGLLKDGFDAEEHTGTVGSSWWLGRKEMMTTELMAVTVA